MHARATMHACNPALLFVILSHCISSHFTLSTLYLCFINLLLTEHLLLLLLHNKKCTSGETWGKFYCSVHAHKYAKISKFSLRYNQVQSIIEIASAREKINYVLFGFFDSRSVVNIGLPHRSTWLNVENLTMVC